MLYAYIFTLAPRRGSLVWSLCLGALALYKGGPTQLVLCNEALDRGNGLGTPKPFTPPFVFFGIPWLGSLSAPPLLETRQSLKTTLKRNKAEL